MYTFFEKQEINIIFLDIDGVLLALGKDARYYRTILEEQREFVNEKLDPVIIESHQAHIAAALCFNKNSVQYIKELSANNNAKIVISSSWRNFHDAEKSKQRLMAVFKLWDMDHLIIDETPYLPLRQRSNEIQQWLNTTELKVNSFIVIDDEDDGLSKAFGEKFVSTWDKSPNKRVFEEKHYDQASKIFSPLPEASLELH